MRYANLCISNHCTFYNCIHPMIGQTSNIKMTAMELRKIKIFLFYVLKTFSRIFLKIGDGSKIFYWMLFTPTHLIFMSHCPSHISRERIKQKNFFLVAKTFFSFPPFFHFFTVKKIENCGKFKVQKDKLSVEFQGLSFVLFVSEKSSARRVASFVFPSSGAPRKTEEEKKKVKNPSGKFR